MGLIASQQAQQQQAAEQARADAAQKTAQAQIDNQNAQLAPLIKAETDAMTAQNSMAQDEWNTYKNTFLPQQQQYLQSVQDYASPEAIQQAGSQAAASVTSAGDQERQAALKQLQGYGIDPSSGESQALDHSARVATGAAAAGQSTAAMQNMRAQGIQLQGQAAGMGFNQAGLANNSYAGGSNSANTAAGTVTSGSNAATSAYGVPLSYNNLASNTGGNYVNSLMGFGQNYTNASANKTSSGLGSLLGLGLGTAATYFGSKAGAAAGAAGAAGAAPAAGAAGAAEAAPAALAFLADGGPAAPQEGGHVPMEASPSGGKAIDDVPARLSPGEFVIPADVVKWYGEKHMYGLIDKSKREREETEANTTAKPDMMAAIPSPPKFVSQSSAIPA